MSIETPDKFKSSNSYELVEFFLAQPDEKPKVIVILGPTASGKTALSLELAQKYHGEIISADSRQVYQEMDIATDKIMPADQKGITHHLLDIIKPDETFSAGDFKQKSEKIITEIHNRGKVPFIVGGTGLYIDALINNFQLKQATPKLRGELMTEQAQHGNKYLHEKLAKLDPNTALKIHPNNTHHLIRALEIVLTTGQPKDSQKQPSRYHTLKIGINWPREQLHGRIGLRVDKQIQRGLIAETKKLLEKYPENLPSMTSLGYPEIISYLRGQKSLPQALENLKAHTRDYAKRQITWFKRDPEIMWLAG